MTDFYENLRYKLPWARAYHEHTLQQMLALADLKGRVLDNGCGNGVFLERLAREGVPGTELVGTDINAGGPRQGLGQTLAGVLKNTRPLGTRA